MANKKGNRRSNTKASQSTSKSPPPTKKNNTPNPNPNVYKSNDNVFNNPTSLNVQCKKCNNKVLELNEFTESKDESIQCDDCNMWFHRPCSNLTSKKFEFLRNSHKSILWKCTDCNLNHGHENKRHTAIEQKRDMMTNMFLILAV